MTQEASVFVSRGGLKLQHALKTFDIDVRGLTACDLGCSTGGFTHCLLLAGAKSVICVDTGYGVLDYRLRVHPQVTVMERTNALHVEPPSLVDLVVFDLSWTPIKHAVPAALRWLFAGRVSPGRVIGLVKPHYERSARDRSARGILSQTEAEAELELALQQLPHLGVKVLGVTQSPILGSGGKHKEGNPEWLVLMAPEATISGV
jgi:23S rRNA (cytidine1920-2'-O)/16S rRNA (cytidine1409-2'-O)-methyltransferase